MFINTRPYWPPQTNVKNDMMRKNRFGLEEKYRQIVVIFHIDRSISERDRQCGFTVLQDRV